MIKLIPNHPVKVTLFVLFCFLLGSPQAATAALTGSYINAPNNVNLSANTPADWIHWGYVPLEFDRKAGVTPQITNFTRVGGADPGATDLASAAYSWSDGIVPGGSISGTTTGERVFQVGKGFQFTVPANTTLKTLRVYVGASSAQGQFTATLSDGSAPAYNISINQNSGRSSREVTLNFRAGSSGQTLTVKYVVTARNSSNGFITLESAALQTAGGGGGAATLTGTMGTVTVINLTTKGPTDWIHWGRISDAPWDRKTGITPLISDQTSVGSNVSPTSSATDTLYSWNDGRPNAVVSTQTGLRVFDINKGFRFTAPADTSTKTLKVYVGLNSATQARFTATLSDGSSPAYSTVVSQSSGRNTIEFTLNYQAASQGQQLVVTFVRSNPRTSGTWIFLESAILLGSGGGGGGGTQPPSAPANVAASDDTYPNRVAVNWGSVVGATYYDVYRSASAGANGTVLASPSGSSYNDTSAIAGVDYFYSVKACNSAGCSGFSNQDPGRRAVTVIVPGIPTGVTASDDTFTTKIAVSWTAISGATNYDVYRSTSLGTTGALFTSPTTNNLNDTSAIAGTSYYYTIKACNSAGCSGFSNQDVGSRAVNNSGTAPANPPGNIAASVDTFTDKVVISWGTVTGATYYELWRSTVSGLRGTQVGLPTGISFDDTTATPGTDYWYGLKACNTTGCSTFSGQSLGRRAVAAAPPTMPTSVSASDDTFTGKIAVNWNSVLNATYYEVYRSAVSGTNGNLLASPLAPNYDDSGAVAGTIYFYSIKACNSAGCSGFSNQDPGRRDVTIVVPGTPSGVAASDDSFTTKIAVSWTTVTGATNYDVYRSTTLGTTGTLFASPTSNNLNDTSAIAGISYYYTIKACNSAGCSSFSNQDVGSRAVNNSGTAPANPPRNIAASVDTFTGKVVISWGTVTGATYYELWRSTVADLKGTQIGLPTGISFDDTTATPGTDYWYGLKACNTTGCSTFSGQSLGRRAITAAPPTMPANVLASDDTFTDKIAVNWSPVSNTSNYEVYRSATSGTTGSLLASPVASNYNDNGAVAGTIYFYSVKACNATGCSTISTQDQGSRAITSNPPANPPTGITATVNTFSDKVTVSWNMVTGTTYYELWRSTAAGTNGTLINSPTGTSFDDTTASPATDYWYSLKACNADGCSLLSGQSMGRRATVPAPPASAPGGLSASDGTFQGKVAISWIMVADATFYEVYRSTAAGTNGTLLASPAGTSIDDTSATTGLMYFYSVKACNVDGCSTFSPQDAGAYAAPIAPPPVITAAADITAPSTGLFTEVDLGMATATDSIDGNLTATPDIVGPFKTGRHIITWSATNSAGITVNAQQIVDILPSADFQMDQSIGEGGTATVSVFLSGQAAVYPVTIPYTVSGTSVNPADHDAASGDLIISSGTAAQITFNLIDDGINDAGETVIFTIGTPVNAVSGANITHVATIIEENLPPQVQLTATQAGLVSSWVVGDSGNVVISSTINDPNPADVHSYDWGLSDNVLAPIGGTTSDTFTFDPAALTTGYYLVKLTVTDNGNPAQSTSIELMLRFETTRPGLSASSDSDNDGIDDATEGYGDSDGDGIADYQDAIDDPTLLSGNAADGTSYLLQSNPGLTMKIGQTATASGLISAAVSEQDIVDNGGNGGSAGISTGNDNYTYPVGIFDFEIGNLPVIGQSADIVIPTLGAIPAGATYRKYISGIGWQDFTEDANNMVASAPGAPGLCPPPGDSSYTSGLNSGDHCIQLTIEDGGPNDADSLANGVVRDPGAVAEPVVQSVTSTPQPTNNSGGGGGALHAISLLLAAIYLISMRRFRRRRICGFQGNRTCTRVILAVHHITHGQ